MADGDKAVRQSTLYTELQKHVHSGDYEKAIKSCNRLLHEAPDDELAFECKIICCVNLTRFEDALEFARKNPTLTRNLNYELAYCHYRLNQTEDALKILGKIDDSKDPRRRELYVQILYRLERYSECYDLYKEICKNTTDNYDEERLSNLSAILASLRNTNVNKASKASIDKGTTFEQKYNYACFLVTERKYELAEKVLLEAEDTCEESFREEGVPDDEIQDELCIMRGLRGYCYQKLGRDKEALGVYTAILKVKPSDVGVLAVVSNNIVVLNRDQNVFDSKKRIKAMKVDNIGYKLTAAQKLTIQLNQGLFYMLTNQDELCQELYTRLLEGEGRDSDDTFCLAACHNFRLKKYNNIIRKEDQTLVTSKPHLDLRIRLGILKLCLEKGDFEGAIKTAKKLAVDQGYPLGLVSSLVVILRQYKSKDEVSAIFQLALRHFQESKKNEKSQAVLRTLWKQAAIFEIEIGEYKKADDLLQELLRFNPDDVLGIALLLTVSIHLGDKNIVVGLHERLPDPDIDEFDIDAAESETSVGGIKYVKKSARGGTGDPASPVSSSVAAAGAGAPATRKKSKKKKKTKLPKNYDPNRSVDPERWMPRYERSGYKPKKARRGRADVGKGTQGVSSEAAEAYDMSRPGASANKTPATDNPQQKKGARRGKGKN